MKKLLSIIGLTALIACSCGKSSSNFFEQKTGVKLPANSKLIFSSTDSTEAAWVWSVPSGLEKFDLPGSLKFEAGYEDWSKPWFGYYGELPESEITMNMKFKVFRTQTGNVAIGRDLVEKKLCLSWIDTSR